MKQKKFSELPILSFGGDYVITGMVFTNQSASSLVVPIPQETITLEDISFVDVTRDDWDELLKQLDTFGVEAYRKGQRVILRKSQRNIDSKISWKVFRRDNFECRYCAIDFVPMTVDHIVTWETGGATHEDNLLCTCKKCNRTRDNLPYEDWLETDYYKEKSKFLTPEVRKANEDIITKLDQLPTVEDIRNR